MGRAGGRVGPNGTGKGSGDLLDLSAIKLSERLLALSHNLDFGLGGTP
jgi:hypothetical protein